MLLWPISGDQGDITEDVVRGDARVWPSKARTGLRGTPLPHCFPPVPLTELARGARDAEL